MWDVIIASFLFLFGMLFIWVGMHAKKRKEQLTQRLKNKKNLVETTGYIKILDRPGDRYKMEALVEISFYQENGDIISETKTIYSAQNDFSLIVSAKKKNQLPVTILYDQRDPFFYLIKELETQKTLQNSQVGFVIIGGLFLLVGFLILLVTF